MSLWEISAHRLAAALSSLEMGVAKTTREEGAEHGLRRGKGSSGLGADFHGKNQTLPLEGVYEITRDNICPLSLTACAAACRIPRL